MSRGDRVMAPVVRDPERDKLRIANLAQAIAGGELIAAWQLGVDAILAVLRDDAPQQKGLIDG